MLCITTSVVHAVNDNNFPVGNYKLHLNQQGEVIKPDEYYVYKAIQDNANGFKKSAIKNFKKAASYGNTLATYYTGLLYLQQKDYINGYAWLSMIDNKDFPHADNVMDISNKIENSLGQEEMTAAKILRQQLIDIYGVEPTFARRLSWSKNFKLTGTNIKGHIPHRLSIITNFSMGQVSDMDANVKPVHLQRAIKNFVYEYDLDYRLKQGNVNLLDFEVLETDQ